MPEYICKKCNKIFTRKSNYTSHINRKYSCIKESKYKCKNCNNKSNFSDKPSEDISLTIIPVLLSSKIVELDSTSKATQGIPIAAASSKDSKKTSSNDG